MEKNIDDNISLNKFFKLDVALKESDIREVAYKFYVQTSGLTDIRISTNDGQSVLIKSASETQLQKDWQILSNIVKKYCNNDKAKEFHEGKEIINNNKQNYFTFQEIINAGACKISPSGNILLLGDSAKLYHNIDTLFLEFAKQENAVEFYSDPFWRAEELHKIGYSHESPYLYNLSGKLNGEEVDYWQIAVCDNIWKSLENSIIEDSITYTTKGTCCRNEGAQIFLFERMKAFTMREIVTIGDIKSITSFQGRAISFLKQIIHKLDLSAFLENANDPFFLPPGNTDQVNEYDLPRVVKQELRLNIYNGKSLAVASCNVHGNFFTKSLNIKHANNDILWTSCLAFGVERWVWSILSQFGPFRKNWPQEIVALVNV